MSRPRLYIPDSLRKIVFAKSDGRCVYCDGVASCLDHIVPWHKSKDDSEGNLAACCEKCNGKLSKRDPGGLEQKKKFIAQEIEAHKKAGLWFAGSKIRTMLRAMRIDEGKAADKCGIDRLRFDELLSNRRSFELADVIAIQRRLDFPGFTGESGWAQ